MKGSSTLEALKKLYNIGKVELLNIVQKLFLFVLNIQMFLHTSVYMSTNFNPKFLVNLIGHCLKCYHNLPQNYLQHKSLSLRYLEKKSSIFEKQLVAD